MLFLLQDEEALEQCLPVVTAHAFHIQEYYNELLETLEQIDVDGLADGDQDKLENQVAELSFVIKELLKMAVELDYSDEMGRRKMWSLIRASPSPPFRRASRRLREFNLTGRCT